jgi:hypothetical protein
MFPEKLPRAWPYKPGHRASARAKTTRDSTVFAAGVPVGFGNVGKHCGLVKVECIAAPFLIRLLVIGLGKILCFGNVEMG